MTEGGALLRAVLLQRRGAVAGAALLLGAHQAFEALVPVVVGAALDEAVATGGGGALARWLVVLAVLFLCLANAFRFGARVATATAERVAHDLRLRLVTRVLDPRGGGEGGRRPGELLSVATADVDAVARVVDAVGYGAGVVVALSAGAVVLLVTSVPLGLGVLVGLPVVVWLAGRLSAPLSRRAAGQQQRAADAAAVAADLVGGHRVLQGIGAEGAAAARYRVASRASLDATVRAARAEAVFESSAVLVAGVALAVVAFFGGRLALAGEISVGELVAAVGVTQFLVAPLSRLAWVGSLLARARASADRLAEALAGAPAVPAPVAPAAVPAAGWAPGAAVPAAAPAAPTTSAPGAAAGWSAAAGLDLHVDGLRHGPLDGLELHVGAGAVHGVVADPAAAAALLDCLGREAAPAAGAVRVGGVDVAALDPAVARAALLVVPHEAALLAGTVGENVDALGPASDDVLAAAAADEVAAALPQGLDTPVHDGGASLSGGQRQRVALARALAAPAPVLVLHEPTTALDAATEARVAAALRAVRGDRTTVLVTASPALLAVCDAVTVVRDGRAAAPAPHADLVRTDPAYRETVLA